MLFHSTLILLLIIFISCAHADRGIRQTLRSGQVGRRGIPTIGQGCASPSPLLTASPPLARHRYDAAETEFVAAKLDMHAKLVQKESLTEHLMVIIQKNEERKAQKLEELMKKMEISEQVRYTTFLIGLQGRESAEP